MRPSQEEQERKAAIAADFEHHYRGYHADGGVCRIRIVDRPEASPLVVASELPENKNTSITNMAEFLWWEVGKMYLPSYIECEDPIEWVEHYPGDPQGIKELRHDRFARVQFENYKPQVAWLGAVQRVRIGRPTWKHLEPAQVDALAGLKVTPYEEEPLS